MNHTLETYSCPHCCRTLITNQASWFSKIRFIGEVVLNFRQSNSIPSKQDWISYSSTTIQSIISKIWSSCKCFVNIGKNWKWMEYLLLTNVHCVRLLGYTQTSTVVSFNFQIQTTKQWVLYAIQGRKMYSHSWIMASWQSRCYLNLPRN